MKTGKTIVAIEGIDGAGKTTIITHISEIFGDNITVYKRTAKGIIGNTLLNTFPLKNNHTLQIIFYLLLSHVNYWKFIAHYKSGIIVMDRCFLSNICYFYPTALNNPITYRLSKILEVALYPSEIYIIDEEPRIAQIRDNMKKSLSELQNARIAYLRSQSSHLLSDFNIYVIPNNLSIAQKVKWIEDRINCLRRDKNDP